MKLPIRLLVGLMCILLLTGNASAQKGPTRKLLKVKAPEEFTASFATTRGEFRIRAYRNWDPEGVDRLYQLIVSGFFTDMAIFRVQVDYVAQFGISDTKSLNEAWEKYPLKDAEVKTSNIKGRIAFARGEPETRTTQLFINLGDNYQLDTITYYGLQGFPPVAEIIEGMDTVEKFYGGYGSEPSNNQDQIYSKGNVWLRENYPELDYIIKAGIIEE
jgi:cyclophilin family peptidyl-prolyl cis-trans isomerase